MGNRRTIDGSYVHGRPSCRMVWFQLPDPEEVDRMVVATRANRQRNTGASITVASDEDQNGHKGLRGNLFEAVRRTISSQAHSLFRRFVSGTGRSHRHGEKIANKQQDPVSYPAPLNLEG